MRSWRDWSWADGNFWDSGVQPQTGKYPPYQGAAAREAAELLRLEMRRIVAVMTGNFEYWGMPDK